MQTGATYTYTYDSQGRPLTLVDNFVKVNGQPAPRTSVNNVQYAASGQLSQMGYGPVTMSETRTYNSMWQLTGITGSGMQAQYTYSATHNNGQITWQYDTVSGEQVSYAYDRRAVLLRDQRAEAGDVQSEHGSARGGVD